MKKTKKKEEKPKEKNKKYKNNKLKNDTQCQKKQQYWVKMMNNLIKKNNDF